MELRVFYTPYSAEMETAIEAAAADVGAEVTHDGVWMETGERDVSMVGTPVRIQL